MAEYSIDGNATASSWKEQANFVFTIIAMGTTGLLVFAYWFVYRDTRRLQPGPRGWPVIGNLLEFSETPHLSLMMLAQKYGPVMFLKMGPIPTVVVSSPDMAREFLKTQDHLFASRPEIAFGRAFFMGSSDIIFAPLGNNFRLLRKICMTELFSPKRNEDFRYVREEQVVDLVERIVSDGREGKLVALNPKFGELSFGTMARLLFGKDFSGISVEGKSSTTQGEKLRDLARQASWIFVQFIPGDVFSWLRRLDWGGLEAKMGQLRDEVVKFLIPIIEDHRAIYQSMRLKDEKMQLKDFVDVLLSLTSKGDKDGLSDMQIVALLQDLIIAGIDTNTEQLTWIFTELMRNPDVREKLRSELDSVVGSTRLVEESDIIHLPYLQAVVKETMRLHPLLPLLVPHESVQATTVGDYHIPEKTRILVHVYAIARDPRVWDNPLSFDPSRFLNTSTDVKGQHFSILPFGSGRRICPGVSHALPLLQLAVAQIIHQCDLSLPEGMSPQDVDIEESSGLSITRLNPLSVIVTPRASTVLGAQQS